jgi:hypothetical protein
MSNCPVVYMLIFSPKSKPSWVIVYFFQINGFEDEIVPQAQESNSWKRSLNSTA